MNHHMFLQLHVLSEIERVDLAQPAEKANASGLPVLIHRLITLRNGIGNACNTLPIDYHIVSLARMT